MKKLISLALTIVFAVTLSISAFAETTATKSQSLIDRLLSRWNRADITSAAETQSADTVIFEDHYEKTVTADEGYLLNIDSVTLNGAYQRTEYDALGLCDYYFPGQASSDGKYRISTTYTDSSGHSGSLAVTGAAAPLYYSSESYKDSLTFSSSGAAITRNVFLGRLPFDDISTHELLSYSGEWPLWSNYGWTTSYFADTASFDNDLRVVVNHISNSNLIVLFNNQNGYIWLILASRYNNGLTYDNYKNQYSGKYLDFYLPAKQTSTESYTYSGTLPTGVKSVTFRADCPIDVKYTQVKDTSVTPTPAPTATPAPTSAPTTEPTATPDPTSEPTATPEPTASPDPTATPTPPDVSFGDSLNNHFGGSVGDVSGSADSALDDLSNVDFGGFGGFLGQMLASVPAEIWLAFLIMILCMIVRVALRIMSGG